MDPMLSQGYGGGYEYPASTSSGSMWIMIAAGCCVLVLLSLSVAYAVSGKSESSSSWSPLGIGSTKTTQAPASGSLPALMPVREEPIPTTEPDSKLASFAFEPLERPGFVPGKDGTLVRRPAGNPPYKLVQCGTSGYAIRWMGRYLTIDGPNKIEWTESKLEPQSCWQIVPGHCDGTHVMLRSKSNKLFVRVEQSGALVCKDTPTQRTAKSFCWKLQPDVAGVQTCGCQYSYDLQRVVCTPCDVKKMPEKPGETCDAVTPGYRTACCVAKGASAAAGVCKTSYWPEVVGRSVKEAMLYLRTRRPDLTLRPCPIPCNVSSYPVPQPTVILIPYDARTGFVTAPARILI